MTGPSLLGVDGGGSATTAWLADASGTVLGRGRAGPSNSKAVGPEAAEVALRTAIRGAFADARCEPGAVEVACLGLAGFDRPEDRTRVEEWSARSHWARRLVLVNDGDIVLAAGTPEGWGVGIVAGTGSIAVGRAPDGRAARVGGWGHLFGDEGSAYAVALAALRRIARLADGREIGGLPDDPLTRRICRELGIGSPLELIAAIYAEPHDRARIAALAPVVVEAAADDEQVFALILEPAGAELALAVAAVARALGWQAGHLPLAMAGGFLLGAEAVSRVLLDRLRSLGYQVVPTLVSEPVAGALALARRALVGGGGG